MSPTAERDELVRVIAEALAPHTIECTGPGEVTCRCREGGWMSWAAHRTHQAAAVVDALGEHLARASSYEIREHADAADFPLDEVVATNPRTVHLERMSRTGWWLGIDMPDGTHIAVHLGSVNERARPYAFAEIDFPTATGTED